MRRSGSCAGSRTSTRPRIGGLGLSVGGELLLQTAAHTRALRAVVSEGAGQRSLAEHLDNPEIGRVQRWFSGMLTQTAAVAVLSNGPPPRSLADLVPRIAPRPVLLIEAVNGNPDEVLNDVYARGRTARALEARDGWPHRRARRRAGRVRAAGRGFLRPQPAVNPQTLP